MINFVQNKIGLQNTPGRRPTHEEAQQLKVSTRNIRNGDQSKSHEGLYNAYTQQGAGDGHGELRAFKENRYTAFDYSTQRANVDPPFSMAYKQSAQQPVLQGTSHRNNDGTRTFDPCSHQDEALDNYGWEHGMSDPMGDDDAQLEPYHHGDSYESQALHDMMFDEVESMDPKERQELGLQSHLGGENGQYARSYPSTTSGRVEETDEVFTQPEDDFTQAERSDAMPVLLTKISGTIDERQHYGSEAPTRTPAGDTIPNEIVSIATTGSKRKALDEPMPMQAAGRTPIERSNTPSYRFMSSNHDGGAPKGSYGLAEHSMEIPVRQNLEPRNEWEQNVHDPASDMIELDYVPESLYTMDFTTLQEESFDQDPHARPLLLHGDEVETSLESRLDLTSGRPAEDQQHFFASLTLTEWEDAGDWFTRKFEEVTSKLKQIRRAKRAMAEGFEEEIGKRYQEVMQETQSLAATLSDMKAKGTLVLSPEKNK